MSFDYGYRPAIGFLRFCDDPELACCQAEKDYLRLKAQETGLYEKAMELEYELTLLRKVADAAKRIGTEDWIDFHMKSLMEELSGTLAEYEAWKEEADD